MDYHTNAHYIFFFFVGKRIKIESEIILFQEKE